MIVRSTLFSRLQYMSRENTELAADLNEVQKQIVTGKRLVKMSMSLTISNTSVARRDLQDVYRIRVVKRYLVNANRKYNSKRFKCNLEASELALNHPTTPIQ